jgi:hypothetical protein
MMEHPELFTQRTISGQLDYLNDWHWNKADEWMAPINCHSSIVVMDDNPYQSRYIRYQTLDSCLTALQLQTMEDTSAIQVAEATSMIKTIYFEEFNIQGFDFLMNSNQSYSGGVNFVYNQTNFKIQVSEGDQLVIKLTKNGDEKSVDLTPSFADFIKTNALLLERPNPKFNIPFQFSWEDEQYRYRFQFTQINFQQTDPLRIFSADGFLLIQKK